MTEVRVGQLWQDADPRIQRDSEGTLRRLVKVTAVFDKTATVVTWYERLLRGEWHRKGEPRAGVIRLTRFRPISTGYRLIQDVEEQS
jgi:hypothetical protein